MGSSASVVKSSQEQREINKTIEKEIEDEKIRQKKIVKILLLGGPASGKTTIFKQMKILHQNGFTKSDYINFRYRVHSNVLKCITQLLDGLKTLKIPMDQKIKEDVKAFREFCFEISSMDQDIDLDLDPEITPRIQNIWTSECIQIAFRKRFSIDLLACTERYLNNIDRISSPNYLPDEQDILLCRKATFGVQEIAFKYKTMTINMVDVGGQKSERRKWIHCFDNVKLILFIVSMSEFDVVSPDTETILLLESLQIFESICSNKFLSQASVVLFLNKKDVFEDKIELGDSSLNACFPDYSGENTYAAASGFISEKFREKSSQMEKINFFFTNATDTKNINKVFGSTADHLVRKNLGSLGLSV